MSDFWFGQSQTAWNYLNDQAMSSIILGPVGSGKSIASLVKPGLVGSRQEPSPDGKRRTRGVIIRNTMPELRATTMDTYGRVYPEQRCGPIIQRSPPEHVIQHGDVEVVVNFIALDRPQDIKRLLSLEVTWGFINELREVPRAVINRLGERLGRYKLEERPTTWRGMWADSNPPDSDHWLYTLDQQDRPKGWNFHHQPPAVLMVEDTPQGPRVDDPGFPQLNGKVISSGKIAKLNMQTGQPEGFEDCPTEIIPSAGKLWIVNPEAENLAALWGVARNENPLGASSYYGASLAGKTIEEIQSYLQGRYVFVRDGKPCVHNYSTEMHSRDQITANKEWEILLAADVGGGTLQPSCIVLQRHPRGPLMALAEIVCTTTGVGEMGMKRFGEEVMRLLQEKFPFHLENNLIGTMWADPAGVGRDEIYEVAALDFLRREFKFDARPAPTNDIKLRISAITGLCDRLYDGVPGLLVSRAGCPMLHKGLSGAWNFKRMAVSGEDRYQDKPNKNDYSHPCDALSYGALGTGEFDSLRGISGQPQAPIIPQDPFAAWGSI